MYDDFMTDQISDSPEENISDSSDYVAETSGDDSSFDSSTRLLADYSNRKCNPLTPAITTSTSNSINVETSVNEYLLPIVPTVSNANVNNIQICKSKRRKHTCLYCDLLVDNFERHLQRQHNDEINVQQFLSLRYYSKRTLRRHVKRCFFNVNGASQNRHQSDGHTLMATHFGPNDMLRTSGILATLQADDISLVAKRDRIICEVARKYIKCYKEKHLIQVARRYMRRLARLLIEVRNIEKNNNLTFLSLLHPSKFKVIVAATKVIAYYDYAKKEFKSPSLALQMGTLIKKAINAAYSIEIQKDFESSKLKAFDIMKKLIDDDWAIEISTEAGQNLNLNRFNKPSIIPMAEDIAKMKYYLDNLFLKFCQVLDPLAISLDNLQGENYCYLGCVAPTLTILKRKLQLMSHLSYCWLTQYPQDNDRAYCKYCKVSLRAHRTDLEAHSKRHKHKQNVNKLIPAKKQSTIINTKIINDYTKEAEINVAAFIAMHTIVPHQTLQLKWSLMMEGLQDQDSSDDELCVICGEYGKGRET
ncbi:hypothetical protein RN001_005951 [Aquatica leii]|uniref:Uncharacterized protein n=1 Tax=Aquatica leii TaxID=1421715 RepID=A0AAN7SIA6_9COLE|nr:hypothetical protein RN001_005951 [Aquatica leii]